MKIVTQSGRVAYDFGDDGLGKGILYKIAVLAKFQDGLHGTITHNPIVSDFIKALSRPEFSGFEVSDETLEQDYPQVHSSLIYEISVRSSAWDQSSHDEKRDIVRNTYFPLALSEPQLDQRVFQINAALSNRSNPDQS